jgi:hypothetical protein
MMSDELRSEDRQSAVAAGLFDPLAFDDRRKRFSACQSRH